MYLNVHSNYSLRYGTLPVEKLVEAAAALGIKAMALTDINNATGAFDFIKQCGKYQVKPVLGIEFREGNKLLYVALAKSNKGFQRVNEFLSAHLAGIPLPEQLPFLEDVYIIYPFGRKQYEGLLQNEYLGIGRSDINNMALRSLRDMKKIVLLHPVTFSSGEEYELHRHLRAIDNNVLLSRLHPDMVASPSHCLHSPSEMKQLYKDFPQALRNTEAMLDACEIYFDGASKNKKVFYDDHQQDKAKLESLAREGLLRRYGPGNQQANERLKKELEVIERMDFICHFLIAWDMVQFSMSKKFYHVGRGSGANSIVAYCLFITDVDPLELDLYFERFLNPKRSVPPDFDIDYCWKDRDTVLDHLFDKYKGHIALLGTISTFRGRSIIRELGKTYGLPKAEIDALTEGRKSLSPKNGPMVAKILHYSELMQDFPNIRSIHAGGVLIGERPISYYTPVDFPPKGYPTVQWDMYVAEEINFDKLDVLSQRGIGHIKDSVEVVKRNRGVDINVHDISAFKNDPRIKAQLKSAITTGCFYVESPAMRQLLKKLSCDNYIHLVAASSIIRPGVASSGMMSQFIERFHHPDAFEYLHPVMKEQLEETFGVMVYQEDVLKICHHYAGMDLGDGDIVRRAMNAKYKNKDTFQQLTDKFFKGAQALGRPEKASEEIWRQICSFGGFSFCKAHSASFAVESFQSMYLKTYFPLEFMVAVINNFGGFYSTWVYVREAARCGAVICLPCVNRSQRLTTINGSSIYLGFIHVQNLETELISMIEEERSCNGSYRSMEDFIIRTNIGREQLFLLIRLGALRDFGSKKELMWEATLHISKESRKAYQKNTAALFELPVKQFVLPAFTEDALEDAYDEIELLGFPVSLTEFDMLHTNYRGNTEVEDLAKHEGETVRLTGNLVTTKEVRTKNGKEMKFGTFMDERYSFFDTVHFTGSMNKFPFSGRGVYLIQGKVICDFGVPAVEVEKLARLPYKADPRN